MMDMHAVTWYLRTPDETFGPESAEKLLAWARLGRIQPGQEISEDNVVWRRVEEVPFLDMRFSIDIGDGNPRGPFNRAAAEALLASGRLPKTATMVETRAPFEEPASTPPVDAMVPIAPAPEPKVIERIVTKEVRVEVPVEKIVEKIVEKPVEKIVEKEVVKTVVDETKVNALTAQLAKETELLDEERRRTAALTEQVTSLEDELRRLPQAASEVADIQAAMYTVMSKEAEELQAMLEAEKAEAEAFRKRHEARADRLLERRRDLLKRAGANIEDMTKRALIERPEDPRTALLRKELEELKRLDEQKSRASEQKIQELETRLSEQTAEARRTAASQLDLTQLQNENQDLRMRLQAREKELTEERERSATLRQREAESQQVMVARLAALESPSIGTTATLSTNQSREAKMVKLPSWMRLRK